MANSNLQFVITNAGLQAIANAQNNGPAVNVTKFAVGSAYGYTASSNMVGLQGTTLYSAAIQGYKVDSLNQVSFILVMDQTVGTFNYGEVGIFLADGTCFAIADFAQLQEKIAASSSNGGNKVILTARLLLSGIAPTISFTNYTYATAELVEVQLPDGLPVPNAANSTDIYSVQSGDETGRPTLAVRETSAALWGFSTHLPFLGGSCTSAGTATQTNCSAITASQFDFVANRYLIQWTSGANKGVVRAVSTVQNGAVTYNATNLTPSLGDSFVIYKSVAATALEYQTRVVYGIDSGTQNAYIVTSTKNTDQTLRDGMTLTFVPAVSATAGNATMVYNGTPSVQIRRLYNGAYTQIAANDMVAGVPCTMIYNKALNLFILRDPANYAQLNGDSSVSFNAGDNVTVNATNPAGRGANLSLNSGSSSTPVKTIRSFGNLLQVVNSAYSAAILSLDDVGNMTLGAGLTATGFALSASGGTISFPGGTLLYSDTGTGAQGVGDFVIRTTPNGGTTSYYNVFYNNGGALLSGPTNVNGALTVAGQVLAAEGTGATGGYSFSADGGHDTGMFSPSDGVLNFYANSVNVIGITPSAINFYLPTTMGAPVTLSSTLTVQGTVTVSNTITCTQLTSTSGSIVFPNGVTIYEDLSSPTGPGDLVVRVYDGTTYRYSIFGKGGTLAVPGTVSAPNFTGLATQASTLSQNGGAGAPMTFNWSGQSGQPPWLWGSSDGLNMFVWNPSNFNVNYANYVGSGSFPWGPSGNGYQKFPSGLIIQWGRVGAGVNQAVINLPIAFPQGAFASIVTSTADSIPPNQDSQTNGAWVINAAQFGITTDMYAADWIAIGW